IGVDRRKCSRQVPFEVISAGFPRTGTASMQEALTILGYPTYHFSSLLTNLRDADMWLPALDAKFFSRDHSIAYPKDDVGSRKAPSIGKKDFDQLLGHVSASTDVPGCLFWEELLDAYGPDVKVVLVDRDLDTWQRSFDGLVDGIMNPFVRHVLATLDPFIVGRVSGVGVGWIRAITGTTDTALAKQRAREAYQKHYAQVRKAVPKDRLLEYRLGSGWEPLCEFLGRPVPDCEFPHVNEAKAL
ncbi:uncharacterized protein B0I36DRAFT_209608, partial [Microdochium trichocladiopsis]